MGDITVDIEDDVEVGDTFRGARKQKKREWKKNAQKRLRYTDHFPKMENFDCQCKHKGTSVFKCSSINKDDLVFLRRQVYSVSSKTTQDIKLSHMMNTSATERQARITPRACRKRNRNLKIVYSLKISGKNVRLCQPFFAKCFGVSQKRLQTIAKRIQSGSELKETRGGDTRSKKKEPAREKVVEFIKKLKGRESHYNRKKSARIYLPSELNIRKLWKMYNSDVAEDKKVNYGFFFNLFRTKFNIGFGTPASDVCSLCYRLKNNLKELSAGPEKVKVICQLRVHKLRAKQFSKLMKANNPESVSFCFDIEQVQPLPKLPISENYDSSQISMYSLCITDVESKSPLFYLWSEDVAKKGGNEVGSALLNFLAGYQYPEGCKRICLFADGCAGQNKNNFVLHALMFGLCNKLPDTISEITLTFPVRGHSYMPADRVFGRVEKILRSKSEMITKEDYHQVYKEVGTIKVLGKDWTLYDLKFLDSVMKKYQDISQMKRFIITKTKNKVNASIVKVKGEILYRNDDL